ncbi:MAG TPA: winged helix DNA-binding domain-containing protein [Thermoleophilaceae bacterium]|nr:winged helix DNA-binding domain-containing protein [Thermoleophilaceae bacterium]
MGQVLAARLTAQLLAGPPARDPVAVAERVFAVQGQDPRGFRLAVRARSEGLSAADVNRALTEDRSLVVTWLNRGTLHLVRSEDYPLLQAVTTPPLRTGSARRLAQEGVSDPERGIALIERALADAGPLTSDALRERLTAAGVHAQGQALYHLLFRASLDGLIVRGPMAGAKQAYVLVRDWLGKRRPLDRDKALGEFARRYLAGHAPATDRDLARWAGISVGDARAGLAAAGDQRSSAAAELPPPKLLGAFEPCLLGWTSREDIVGDEPSLVTAGGMFYPFAMVRGRAVAKWRLADGQVELDPFRRISKADRAALERDGEDVVRFLG